jgi:SAM-dependent methyltransferase
MNPYRLRILPLLLNLLRERAPAARALDFGSGDGWFATQMRASGLIGELVPVDVQARPNSFVEPIHYDGMRLPFDDRSFDLVYSVDVLHHGPDPAASLRDLVRCSSRLLLLKDHTWRTRAGKLTLAVLDEIGNRKFGIPCLYRYQRRWEWFDIIESEGFRLVRLIHPAVCHAGLMGRLTNSLQFAALWERSDAKPISGSPQAPKV